MVLPQKVAPSTRPGVIKSSDMAICFTKSPTCTDYLLDLRCHQSEDVPSGGRNEARTPLLDVGNQTDCLTV